MKTRLLLAAALAAAAMLRADAAYAGRPFAHVRAARHASSYSWHGGYYHVMWRQPVALVVPPTAESQTKWSWGVAQTSVTPIWQQFERPWPGPYAGGMGFRPAPPWPSHTDQFGVYYVRGPWE